MYYTIDGLQFTILTVPENNIGAPKMRNINLLVLYQKVFFFQSCDIAIIEFSLKLYVHKLSLLIFFGLV